MPANPLRSRIRQLALIAGLALLSLAVFWLIRAHRHATEKVVPVSSPAQLIGSPTPETTAHIIAAKVRSVAPFIVADTATDSPGTNLETRVVTFTATVGGTPPIFLQWEVDHGTGFGPVSAGATNAVFKILNAHLSDTGRYALFATNAAGSLHTTPVPLVIVEAGD